MELRHLRYFIAVAEEGSLTLAAEKRLHTAQPSLSRQIRDLEYEVGVPLMIRSVHGIELTAAGRAFLDHARLALPQALLPKSHNHCADPLPLLIQRLQCAMDTSPQSQADHTKLVAQIKRQAPELVQEWLSVDTPSQQLKARAHLERHGVSAPLGAKFTTIGPLTIRQLNVFSHKAALALYFR